MTVAAASYSLTDALARTRQTQAIATDPRCSVWVSANAGTGKTFVLTRRVVRLLLAGTPPERILCLTYTKAAASEMSTRVFALLASWIALDEAELDRALSELLGRAPSDEERRRARTLFTAAVETPGGLKVQTIHAFAERLLQRFPLEAGVPPGFVILDDAQARQLRRASIDAVLAKSASNPAGRLGRALDTAVAYASEDRFDDIIAAALSWRDWLETAVRLPEDPAYDGAKGLALAEALYRQHFAVRPTVTTEAILNEMAAILRDCDLSALAKMFRAGTTTDQDRADDLQKAAEAPDAPSRVEALSDFFMTAQGGPRARLMTNRLAAQHPAKLEVVSRAQVRFVELDRELKALAVVDATMALHHLASAVLQNYQRAKQARAALDFDDLIAHTCNLLASRSQAQWVLYKLDSGLEHLLVDESQDTSPDQWRIVATLAEEFFAGTGAIATPRTVFAVGDEKQSIYSFQGAAPEMFAEMGRQLADRARHAAIPFHHVALDVSFRTTAPVLETVDRVFSNADRTPGIPQGMEGIRHVAKRLGQAGSVEVWRPEPYVSPSATPAFAPLDEEAAASPIVRLADRIAATIGRWLADGEILASAGRPVRAGDIMILVRKRRPFAPPMIAALKSRGIPVAGTDRLALTDHIAVQDLISLGEFLTLPENDLALAEVLKSPIFDFNDQDVFQLAHGRRGTLWQSLLEQAKSEPRFAAAADDLRRWRKAADFAPPFEFFSTLIERDGVRQRLLARLGAEAADPIDEFLDLALAYDDTAPPSLTGFLHALDTDRPEIKRDMDHGADEVRVMTIHGAKGLEAPIVFLPDTCQGATRAGQSPRLIPLANLIRPGVPHAQPFVWPIKGSTSLQQIGNAKAALARTEREESDRLLYVALTRPRDRLIVCGYEGRQARPAASWWDTIATALDIAAAGSDADPVVYRSTCDQSAPPDGQAPAVAADAQPLPLPDWVGRPAPREPATSLPLAPSRLAAYESDSDGEPLKDEPIVPALYEPAGMSPVDPVLGDRFLRGTVTHLLLEYLPTIEPPLRLRGAHALLERHANTLSESARASILQETFAILDDPTFSAIFGPESQAEVPIVAELADPAGKRPPMRLAGAIDRLALVGDDVLIVDYKTNRSPPDDPSQVAEIYLFQLAAYRLAVEKIYPGRRVRGLLLWTHAARLMEIPRETLDTYACRLWQRDSTA
jgi:ATP-dependent helicase/nuclease subunit A